MIRSIICAAAFLLVGTSAHAETRNFTVMLDPFTTITGKLEVPSEIECTATSSPSLQTRSCKTPGAELQLNGPSGVSIIVVQKSQLITSTYSGKVTREYFFEGVQDLAGQDINVGVQFTMNDERAFPGTLTFNRGKTSYPLVLQN